MSTKSYKERVKIVYHKAFAGWLVVVVIMIFGAMFVSVVTVISEKSRADYERALIREAVSGCSQGIAEAINQMEQQ